MKKILLSALCAVFAFSGFNAEAQKVLKPIKVERHDFAKEDAKYQADVKQYTQLAEAGKTIPEELWYLESPDGGPYDTVGDGDGWYNAGGPSSVTASSHLAPQGKYTYEAKCAHDFSLITPWCEGVEGNGIGEWLLYKFETNFQRV
ncbi:MAG: hypothetical protein MJZ66_09900, partial [Bacteroidales bacterium]|nr:hypothetical protein [Bacteroidales bacterium]